MWNLKINVELRHLIYILGEICSDAIHANAGPPSQLVRVSELSLLYAYHK